jgi:hypothetical protein
MNILKRVFNKSEAKRLATQKGVGANRHLTDAEWICKLQQAGYSPDEAASIMLRNNRVLYAQTQDGYDPYDTLRTKRHYECLNVADWEFGV